MEHHHTNQVAKEEDLIPQPPQRDGAEEDKAPSCVNLRFFFFGGLLLDLCQLHPLSLLLAINRIF